MTQTENIACQLTGIFENDNLRGTPLAKIPLEKFVENLGDGRGYTCNCIFERGGQTCSYSFGFTTADEEVVLCVEAYIRRVPINHLGSFIRVELEKLKNAGSADTRGLDKLDFKEQWRNACHNPAFREAYAEVAAQLFGVPAQKHCDELGLQTPVAYAVLFDSIVQHGNDDATDDPDSAPAILRRTALMYGLPRPAFSEKAWLFEFLDFRRATLENPFNRASAKEWAKSTGRIDSLEWLVSHNPQFVAPVAFAWEGENYEVTP